MEANSGSVEADCSSTTKPKKPIVKSSQDYSSSEEHLAIAARPIAVRQAEKKAAGPITATSGRDRLSNQLQKKPSVTTFEHLSVSGKSIGSKDSTSSTDSTSSSDKPVPVQRAQGKAASPDPGPSGLQFKTLPEEPDAKSPYKTSSSRSSHNTHSTSVDSFGGDVLSAPKRKAVRQSGSESNGVRLARLHKRPTGSKERISLRQAKRSKENSDAKFEKKKFATNCKQLCKLLPHVRRFC